MEYELQLGKNSTLEEYMPAYTTFGAPASATAIPTYHIHISRYPALGYKSSAIITLKIYHTPRHYFFTFAPTINVHY
jgi:hypothetical protein